MSLNLMRVCTIESSKRSTVKKYHNPCTIHKIFINKSPSVDQTFQHYITFGDKNDVRLTFVPGSSRSSVRWTHFLEVNRTGGYPGFHGTPVSPVDPLCGSVGN